ncbi:MAG: hypothetical protein RLZZ61_1530 [Pseudomonadota bacterium]|jgi:hypothetical protein
MTGDGGNGTAIIRKAGGLDNLGAMQLLSLCNLYVGRWTKADGIPIFFQKMI